jgi:hypothetical protein
MTADPGDDFYDGQVNRPRDYVAALAEVHDERVSGLLRMQFGPTSTR